MSLDPVSSDVSAKITWTFCKVSGQIQFVIAVGGAIPIDFANKALEDAKIRKEKAFLIGDGISLDLILGGLTKKAIQEFEDELTKDS